MSHRAEPDGNRVRVLRRRAWMAVLVLVLAAGAAGLALAGVL